MIVAYPISCYQCLRRFNREIGPGDGWTLRPDMIVICFRCSMDEIERSKPTSSGCYNCFHSTVYGELLCDVCMRMIRSEAEEVPY